MDHAWQVDWTVCVVNKFTWNVTVVDLVYSSSTAARHRNIEVVSIGLLRWHYFHVRDGILIAGLAGWFFNKDLSVVLSWRVICLAAVGLIVVHIGHEDRLGVLLVDKNIGLNEFNAFIVERDLDPEVVAEVLYQFVTVDVRIEGVSSASEDEDGSEKVNHHGVHDGISWQSRLYSCGALSEDPKELHNELFELNIGEEGGIVVLEKNELEALVVEDLLDLVDVTLVVHSFELET